MPWVPELFSAPVLARFEAKQRRKVVDVPYFDGLLAGDTDALVESFAGEPRLHHPLRGHIEGEYEFREFVADSDRWLREHNASIEDLQRSVLPDRGFEEVIVHLDTPGGPIDLPHAMVADHTPDGHLMELRIYFSTMPLTGHATERAPLLPPDPELRKVPLVDEYAEERAAGGFDVEPCILVDDGDASALEYNTRRRGDDPSPQAGLTVLIRGTAGKLAATRIYEDLPPPAASLDD
jgi:hypothetical protein